MSHHDIFGLVVGCFKLSSFQYNNVQQEKGGCYSSILMIIDFGMWYSRVTHECNVMFRCPHTFDHVFMCAQPLMKISWEAMRWLSLLPELVSTVQRHCSYYYCSNPACIHSRLLANPPLKMSPGAERNRQELIWNSAAAQNIRVNFGVCHTCVACSPLAHMYAW